MPGKRSRRAARTKHRPSTQGQERAEVGLARDVRKARCPSVGAELYSLKQESFHRFPFCRRSVQCLLVSILFLNTPVACGWTMQIPAAPKGKIIEVSASNKEGAGERVHAEVNYLQIGSYTSTSDT